jgi:hypothetical protein
MKKKFTVIACVCIVIAILSPLASYVYFCSRFKTTFESYKLQIWDVSQENEKLEEIKRFMETYEKSPYLMKPYLVTKLGWYMHDSSDPVPSSRNTFTIYGEALNVGATTAVNCMLIVDFYDNVTLLQSSEVDLGDTRYWSTNFVRRVIDCDCADSITRVEVTPKWSLIE